MKGFRMPLGDHLRALMIQYAPGRSPRELTEAAGVPASRLEYWLKPGTIVTRMPKKETIAGVAHIIGCPTTDAYAAFRAGVDPEAYLELPDDERKLLGAYRRLSEPDRQRALAIIGILGRREATPHPCE